jgi:hypothetical protein
MDDVKQPKPEQDEKGRFIAGNSGNGGRPKGSRNKLGEAFIEALQASFEQHGPETIETVRTEKPDQYLKVIASLLPKDVNLTVSDERELTDEQLIERVRTLTASIAPLLAGGVGADANASAPPKGKKQSPSVH